MRSRVAGFTLIEILVVVAFIGVLAAATGPLVTAGMARYSVISASQQVASSMRSARFQAVGRNTNVRVRFDAAASEYEIEAWDAAAASWMEIDGVRTLPAGVTFDTPPAAVEFGTNGRLATGALAANIVVTNGDATHDRTISVATTGRVQLVE